jgi:TP901 family phage tail tape measure protein
MADVESNINIDINTSDALSSLRLLQKEISNFHQVMSKTGAISGNNLKNMQQNLVNSINSTGQFSATLQRVTTTTESFTNALEKNKLSMGQYFKYAGASTQTFGRLFRNEFDTIEKVARERVKTLQTQYIKLGRDANGAMQAIAVRPQVLDMKDLGTQTAMAAQKTQLFNQLMKQGSTDLLNFGKNTQWAGRQLMVGFTIPLGIMGASAAKEFKAIEDQVLRLERVYGDFTTTVGDTEKITSQIRDLAGEFTKYGVSVAKTMGLAADAAAMGKTGADLIAQVAEANRLAVLGGVDQAQSLETTISMTNAFGVSAEKLAGKIDFLNAVENQTVTSIEDLTKAIPTAGPVVQQLGGSVEDLAFFMTAMKEGGIDAGEGANALKSGLASLINPTREAIDQLNGFGINIESIRDANTGDVAGMVKALATELSGLSDLNKAQAIETMFGKFQFARMSTLFKNVIAEGSQASRVLDLTAASTGELAALSQKELSKIEASPLYKFQGAIENFKAALAPVGEEFMKAVTPLINFGTDILNKFNEMSDGGKQFVVILTGAVAGIGPVLLMTFGLIANGVANIIKGFLFLKNIFTGVGNSTNTLTSQLNYMTTEQMNANAVAVSLGQVHTNLIGTFNAEAASVRNLSSAYVSAIATQSQFMGPIVSGKGTKNVKKMASGGLVAGSGNGDTVPAMLTPGEFVLTKGVTSKYPGLISAMMSGSIAGYAKGGLVQAHLQGALDLNDPAVIAQMEKTYPGFSKLSEQQRGMYQASGSLTADVGGKLNEGLKRKAADGSVGVVSDTFLKAWNSVENKLGTAAKQAGVGNLTQTIEKIEKEIGAEAVKLAGAGGKVSDEILAKATTNVLSKRSKMGGESKQVADALTQRAQTLGDVRSAPGKVGAAQLRSGLDSGDLVVGSDNHIYPAQNGKQIPGTPPVGRVSQSRGPKQSTKLIAGGYRSTGTSATVTDADNAMLGTTLVEAKKEEVKTTKRRTATSKKVVEQETQMLKDAKRSEAAKKGWETRRAREATVADQSSPSRKSIGSRLSGKAGMIGMGLSGAMMAGSMMGGPVGEAIGAFSGPLMGASMALQMLPGPVGLVVAGLAAVAGVALTMKQKFDEAQRSAENFAQSTQASTAAMDAIAEAAGTNTASQIMDARRSSSTDLYRATEEQNAVAQSYLGSEFGKSMMSSLGDSLKSGGSQGIANVANQMATAVTQGAISAIDAKAVIQNIGAELGDSSFAIKATAQLDKLIGPNGEDISKDPVKVRLDIMKQQSKQVSGSGNALGSLGIGADGVLGGLAAGAAIGSIIPGVGTGLGAALGLAVGGTIELFSYYEKLGAASGAFASNVVIASQQSQQMLDSLQLDYETRIATAKAAGDTAEADRLSEEYVKGRQKILDQSAKDQKAGANAYGNLSSEKKTSTIGSLDQQIKDMYSEGPMKAIAEQAISQIGGAILYGSTVEFTLKTAVASGDIDPTTMNNTLDLIAAGGGQVQVAADLITNFGTADADRIMQFAAFADKPEQSVKFLTSMTDLTPEATAKVLGTLDTIGKYGGEAILNLAVESDVSDIQQVQASLDAVDTYFADGQQKVYSAELKFGTTGFDLTAAQAEYYNSLAPSEQKEYVSAYVTVLETIDMNTADGREQMRKYARDKEGANYFKTGKYSKDTTIGGKKYKTDYAAIAKDMAADAAAAAVAAQRAMAAQFQGGGSSPVTDSGGGGGSSSEPDLPTLAEQYQAALSLISDTEDDINKKYEKRLSALDEIAKAQEAISEQQRDQLDIADALTKGDIASAARAVQASRQNAAKRAQDQQRQALEAAKSAELANVTYNGYTRAWYEAQLKALEASENARIAAGQAKAKGGLILGPGNGTSDSIPAMLSNGEYVIRAAAVRAIGVAQLERLNNIDRMGFAGGGRVASGRMLGLGRAKRFNTSGIGAPSFSNMSASELDTSSLATAAAPVMINNTTGGNSVYNYSVNVNAATNSDPNQIANSVMRQIRNVEQRRVRGNYING